MAFKDFPEQDQGARVLQRSLARGRLAHAYLFTGHDLGAMESIATTLAKTLNCMDPLRSDGGAAIDCCDRCLNCRKIDQGNHADVHWARPESKSRVITIDQMRALMQEIGLKPTEAEYKVAVIVAADRLNSQAANAFLKTLEEPPPKSILILLTTEPQRVLETILSRCLILHTGGEGPRPPSAAELDWLRDFSEMAAAQEKSLLQRYRLLDLLLQKLTGVKSATEEDLASRSPLQRYEDADPHLREKWEDELSAAVEAEYRRQRSDVMLLVERWLRDVWVRSLAMHPAPGAAPDPSGTVEDLLNFPQLSGAERVARRLSAAEALHNLQVMETTQRLLQTNVQEALALEVGLLKLHL